MPITKLSRRFQELLEQSSEVEATKTFRQSQMLGERQEVKSELLIGWCVKCRNLLEAACGKESAHYEQFIRVEKPSTYRDSWTALLQLRSVVLAAQEDYDGGYLDNVRSLVQAEVFGNELEQADELLQAGYETPAAIVAGVVLETKLRDMCTSVDIARKTRQNECRSGESRHVRSARPKADHGSSRHTKQCSPWASG